MLALYRSGRQAEALEAFQEGRRVLVDQLGIDPSPRLQQLHGAFLRQEAGLDPARAAPAQDHFEDVVQTILAGRVVPVLGTDVAELTATLAQRFGYPSDDGAATLPRVAQYVAVMRGSGPLYDELHALLDTDLPPTAIHRFLASLPPVLREHGLPHQLLVTTSYDTALERAFEEAGESFEIVSYLAAGRNRGRFCHIAADGTGRLIDQPNTYATELSLERSTVILKLHGQVERTSAREWESFVVTEDDYIDYLAQTEVAAAVTSTSSSSASRSTPRRSGATLPPWRPRPEHERLGPSPAQPLQGSRRLRGHRPRRVVLLRSRARTGGGRREPPRLAAHRPLRAERRREDLAPARGGCPLASRLARRGRRRLLVLGRRPAGRPRHGDRRGGRNRGGRHPDRAGTRGVAGRPRPRLHDPRPVRGGLPLPRPGPLRRRARRRDRRPGAAGELPARPARGRAREAGLLQGAGPEPLRELPAPRSPRSRRRACRDPRAGRSLQRADRRERARRA